MDLDSYTEEFVQDMLERGYTLEDIHESMGVVLFVLATGGGEA